MNKAMHLWSYLHRSTMASYFGRRFLLTFIALFAGCLVLIFVIDTVENLRRASSHDVGLGTVLLLSLYRLPSLSELVLPFAVLFAAMATFLALTRSLELVIARSAGVSVWQFILPTVGLAFLIGVVATVVYNPLSAAFKARHEALYAEAFQSYGATAAALGSTVWLHQNGADGPSILYAKASSPDGLRLTGVMALLYDQQYRFVERIEAESAALEDGAWRLTKAWVIEPGRDAQQHSSYLLSTYLTRAQVRESVASAETVSFWALPGQIAVAERAGLRAIQYRLQYQGLLARPLLLCAMVLIAATFSLRVFRFGNIGRMILGGIATGFVLYVISKLAVDLGKAGAVSPFTAAWAPAFVFLLLGMTILLYQEDG